MHKFIASEYKNVRFLNLNYKDPWTALRKTHKLSIRPKPNHINCRSGVQQNLQKHRSNFRGDPIFVDAVTTEHIFL